MTHRWVNLQAGTDVPYTQRDNYVDAPSVPGDFSALGDPHAGAAFKPADNATCPERRPNRDLNGAFEFRAGPHDFPDHFIDDERTALEPLCAAPQ